MVNFFNKTKCFRIVWKTFLDSQHLLYNIFYMFCLLSCREVANGKEAMLQRRFMWKQMHAENLVGDMGMRTYSMKHMISDLVPNRHSMHTNKLLDYLPSETTRVKYIIHNPSTKKPIKIIKIRPSKKMVKIMTKPTITTDSNTVSLYKDTIPTYLNSDHMEKLEKEQELIAEGRLSFKHDDMDQHNRIYENKTYSQQLNQDTNDGQNAWLPFFDSFDSPLKPITVSPLHTSIMAETLPKPEKYISQQSIMSIGEEQADYHGQHKPSNGYEVTEHIAEESIALPLTQGSKISFRIGATPPRYSLMQPTSTAYRDKFEPIIATSTSTEEPPNYPANFLRRFQERLHTATVLPPSNTTTSAPPIRFKQRKNSAELNVDWTPSNISNTRETFKFRGRVQGFPARIKSEKWPPEIIPSSTMSNFPLDKQSTSDNFSVMKSLVLTSTNTAPILATEIRDQVISPPPGRSRKQPPFSTVKMRQNIELPKLQYKPEHNRGTIKFGDKILMEEEV